MLLVCFEALVVYNVASWERVLLWFQGMRRAKHARASLVAAQQRRGEDWAPDAAEGERAAAAAADAGAGSLSRAFAPPRGRGSPWTWSRGKGGGGSGPNASSAAASGGVAGRRAAAGSELDDYDDFALGEKGGSGGMSVGGGGGGGAPSAAANGDNARATTFSMSRDGSLTRSRRRRQAIARQLDAEARASWYAYVAWR